MNNKSEMRVLYINGGTMDMGGISSYMMNYYRQFDKTRIQVDFIVHGEGGVYDEEIERMGGVVYHIPTKRENLWGNILAMTSIMKSGKYKIVHAHMDGMNGLVLKRAKQCGIKTRISHSHNTEHLTTNSIKKKFHEYSRKKIGKYATQCWACSGNAGKWLYGEKTSFEVVPNAIEVKRYLFDEEKRREVREKLQLEGKFVIGHIGRFDYQKNHAFLLSAFAKVAKAQEDAVLLLIGDGDLRQNIEEQIIELGIAKKVILLGRRKDIDILINAFDLFVLPSRFEGLGIVVLEAQANGLPCICSKNVPKEVNITNNVEFLDIAQEQEWADAMIQTRERKRDVYLDICKAGYEISSAAKWLQEKYISLGETK